MIRRLLLALLLLAAAPAFAQPQAPSPALQSGAERVVGLLKGEIQPAALFNSAFRAQVPDAQLLTPAEKTAIDVAILEDVSTRDLVGYHSGHYQTIGNNPAIYADLENKVFVMMGKKSVAELPMATNSNEAATAFETFIVLHGYAANGKQPIDSHQKVTINGQEMVVMTRDELLPTMPTDVKAHFTAEQFNLLENQSSRNGYRVIATRVPLMYCYAGSIVVLGANEEHEFPVAQATDAFVAFRKLLPLN